MKSCKLSQIVLPLSHNLVPWLSRRYLALPPLYRRMQSIRKLILRRRPIFRFQLLNLPPKKLEEASQLMRSSPQSVLRIRSYRNLCRSQSLQLLLPLLRLQIRSTSFLSHHLPFRRLLPKRSRTIQLTFNSFSSKTTLIVSLILKERKRRCLGWRRQKILKTLAFQTCIPPKSSLYSNIKAKMNSKRQKNFPKWFSFIWVIGLTKAPKIVSVYFIRSYPVRFSLLYFETKSIASFASKRTEIHTLVAFCLDGKC